MVWNQSLGTQRQVSRESQIYFNNNSLNDKNTNKYAGLQKLMLEPLISVKLPPQKDYEADVSNIRPSRRVNARNVFFIILTGGNLTLVTGA